MKKAIRFISSKKVVIIAAIIIAACIIYIPFTRKDSKPTEASNSNDKFYTSILVEKGDTLWGIAEKYMTEEYKSTQEYIDEVLEINDMNTNIIVDGTYLLIPYYADHTYE